MTKYLRPNDILAPAQGTKEYTPQVIIFSEATPEALQLAINGWLTGNKPNADTFYIHSTNYAIIGPSLNKIIFSALIHYTKIAVA